MATNGGDALDGFRGKSRADIEQEFREKLGPNAHLIDVYQIGEEMKGFMAQPAGLYLAKCLIDDLNDNLGAMLEQDDPALPAARQHWFKARAAYDALGLIQTTIQEGQRAEHSLDDDQR